MAFSATERKNDPFKLYDEAIRLLNKGEFEKARAILADFEIHCPDRIDMVARANTFLKICESRSSKPSEDTLEASQNPYLRGLVEHNLGHYRAAAAGFKEAMLEAPSGDHIHLAMAATEACQGNHAEALKHLGRAIELNRNNRYTALNDPDFEQLHRNEEFQKLVHPRSGRK